MFTKVDRPFLIAAFASLIVGVTLWFLVNRDYEVFVSPAAQSVFVPPPVIATQINHA
ncbi:MAG: hypothetical protein H0X34_00300 [Chthoniobacterales bacterium]|nr:hypothetical protein [Chthoniobacterales bacterium]